MINEYGCECPPEHTGYGCGICSGQSTMSHEKSSHEKFLIQEKADGKEREWKIEEEYGNLLNALKYEMFHAWGENFEAFIRINRLTTQEKASYKAKYDDFKSTWGLK